MKKLTGKQIGLIAIAGLAGIFLAVWLARTRYGKRLLMPVVNIEGRLSPAMPTPVSALPHYAGFGENYDTFGIWPYGASSNYQLFLNTNSGIPTTQLPGTAGGVNGNMNATALNRPLFSGLGMNGNGRGGR